MLTPDSKIRRRGGTQGLVLLSLGVLAVSTVLLLWLGGVFNNPVSAGDTLIVYCAVGVMPAVEPVAKQYEEETGVTIQFRTGPSGVLEQQIKQSGKGDLFIPADASFIERLQRQQHVAEVIPLARFRLVLAVRPENEKKIASLDDLLRKDVGVAIADRSAAVGKTTEKVLLSWPGWAKLHAKAIVKPTVSEVASDVRIGVRIDAGLIWDANARQMGLKIVDVPEIKDNPAAVSTIEVGVLGSSKSPTEALRFARYLAAPEKGQKFFAAQHYERVPGDPWAVTPKLVLFSGGLNRVAIEETLGEFQEREGCQITPIYQGCGTLVTMMKSGQQPDAYFACDTSFMTQVQDRFDRPTTLSDTEMVMLVRKGNPQGIHKLSDLGRPGIRVGIADEKLTALGSLTMKLLRQAGVYDQVVANRRATTPTADLLVLQMTTVDKLDAAIVYQANCNYVADKCEIVSIDHPGAKAYQPFAVHRQTKYPQLMARLLSALTTAESRRRFESKGFRWQVEQAPQP